MKTKAVRMYGAMDLRTEEFELPEISADEVLITSSTKLCLLAENANKKLDLLLGGCNFLCHQSTSVVLHLVVYSTKYSCSVVKRRTAFLALSL